MLSVLSLIHISEPTRPLYISYAVFCLKKIFLMIRRPPRSTHCISSAASDVYKRQMLFSLQVFLFAPLVTYCIKKYSFRLHLCFSISLMAMTLSFVYTLHRLLFVLLLSLLVFVNVVCPYWLIRIQEYKFEITGPWDEAKLCFDITD